MFLKGNADFLNLPQLQRHSSCLFLLLCTVVLQSCALSSTATNLIPGKELSRSSLGFRETKNVINIKESNPYTVVVTRNICKSDLLSIEYQAVLETKQATYALDCSDLYVNYISHNITAVGVPLLYDSLTGFYLLREKCSRLPPVYQINIAESNTTIKTEAFDTSSTVCQDIPVKDTLVTAKVNDDVIEITTSAQGIASLPPLKLAEIKQAAADSSINYRYEGAEITTVYLLKQREKADSTETQMTVKPGRESDEKKSGPENVDIDDSSALNKDGENAVLKNSNATTANPQDESGRKQNMLPKEINPLLVAPQQSVTQGAAKPRLIVRFASNKTVIKKEYRFDLRKIADEMKRDSSLFTIIEGHTDGIGSAEINLKVSLRRAAVIKDHFVKLYGVPAERILIRGVGLTQPIADNGTKAGRAENRRTEIRIITQSAGI